MTPIIKFGTKRGLLSNVRTKWEMISISKSNCQQLSTKCILSDWRPTIAHEKQLYISACQIINQKTPFQAHFLKEPSIKWVTHRARNSLLHPRNRRRKNLRNQIIITTLLKIRITTTITWIQTLQVRSPATKWEARLSRRVKWFTMQTKTPTTRQWS